MINIVIPMAGRGSRFVKAGYQMPKPLIDVHNHPMIEYVVQNIRPRQAHKFIFICQQEHLERYDLARRLERIAPGSAVVAVDHVTEGAACTVLLAQQYIDNDDALMIANSDQYVDININKYLAAMGEYDGMIMTMPASDPKWSYIRYDENKLVTLVREKEVISDQATVGIYNYRQGRDFVRYAHQMITRDVRVNGEFYVAPVYNEMIEDGKKLTFYDIGDKMYGLGIPEDLEQFIRLPLSRNVFGDQTQ